MARKRKPLVLNDVIVELDAPGLQIVRRPNGELWQYWVVSHEGRRRGYLPRTIRLHYDLTNATGRLELEHRCKILTNEMLVWLGDPEGEKKPLYDGTVAALIRCYQTDKNSPYIKACVRTRPACMRTGAALWNAQLGSVVWIT
jgi:hypothetical protein